jgi:hypothetical protein
MLPGVVLSSALFNVERRSGEVEVYGHAGSTPTLKGVLQKQELRPTLPVAAWPRILAFV